MVTGNCHKCKRDAEISITKTSGGYGFLGGLLYERSPCQILMLCCDCYELFGHLMVEPGPDTCAPSAYSNI
jgi:hypothetical protein